VKFPEFHCEFLLEKFEEFLEFDGCDQIRFGEIFVVVGWVTREFELRDESFLG